MSVTSASISSISTDSGSSSTDFTTNDTTLTFAGVYSAGLGAANLYLWIDGTLIGTISASGSKFNAAWTYTYATALAEGSHTVVINTSNTSVSSGVRDTQAVVIDTTVAAPTVALTTDSGASAVDNITKVGTLSVSGTESAATVEYSANGTSGWSTTAPALTQGSNTVYVRQTDLAGNVSASTTFTFTYDSVAPSSLSASTLVLATASDSGVSSSDEITNVTTPTVTTSSLNGIAMSAGEVIQVVDTSNSNAVAGTYVVQAADLSGGTWSGTTKSITLSTLASGDHALALRLVDEAGNVGTAGQSNTITSPACGLR